MPSQPHIGTTNLVGLIYPKPPPAGMPVEPVKEIRVEANESMRLIPDHIARQIIQLIPVRASCEVRRVDDNLLVRLTYKEIEGVRFGFEFCSLSLIKWCVFTAPIDQKAYVLVTPDRRDLHGFLVPLTASGGTRLYPTRELAEAALAHATANPAKMANSIFPGTDLASSTVVEIPVASDELRCDFITSEIARQRLTGSSQPGHILTPSMWH